MSARWSAAEATATQPVFPVPDAGRGRIHRNAKRTIAQGFCFLNQIFGKRPVIPNVKLKPERLRRLLRYFGEGRGRKRTDDVKCRSRSGSPDGSQFTFGVQEPMVGCGGNQNGMG